MTCIAGIVSRDGRIIMGGDSAGVNTSQELQLRSDTKVFRNGSYVIGVCGSWLVNQRLKFGTLPSCSFAGTRDSQLGFMVQVFLPWLQATMPVDERYEFLLGFDGVIYHFYSHRQVSVEQARFEACGSGAQVARGAMHIADRLQNIMLTDDQLVAMALQAAERFCSGVRGPFHIEELKR